MLELERHVFPIPEGVHGETLRAELLDALGLPADSPKETVQVMIEEDELVVVADDADPAVVAATVAAHGT